MAPSAEICGSGGNAADCGSRLCLAGVIASAVGFAGSGNRSFTEYLLEVNEKYRALDTWISKEKMKEINEIGSIESREHFKNILPKCGITVGAARCIGDNPKGGVCRDTGEKRFGEINPFKYSCRSGQIHGGKGLP